VLGILAACLLISGIIVAFFHSLVFGTLVLMGTAFSMPFVFMLLVKIWPMTPMGKAILMSDEETTEDVLPKSEFDSLEGQIGTAQTKMLPSGIILIDGQKYDALSDGFAIEAGDTVKVISVRENRIYVEPFDGDVNEEDGARAADTSGLSTPLEELGIEEDFLD
jgi:membrane-bound serine protease (ClpP class)